MIVHCSAVEGSRAMNYALLPFFQRPPPIAEKDAKKPQNSPILPIKRSENGNMEGSSATLAAKSLIHVAGAFLIPNAPFPMYIH